jgi:hypothetical protein
MSAEKQPLAACGKLTPRFMEPNRIARDAKMTPDAFVAPIRRFRK